MMTDKEPGGAIPASVSRLHAAARRGLFPRSRLLVTGSALLAGAAALALGGERLATLLIGEVRGGLERSLLERGEPAAALAAAVGLALCAILLLLAAPATVSLAIGLATALRARRARGVTAVPLPPERPRELSPAAPRLAALALMSVAIPWVLGRHRELPAAWLAGDQDAAGGLAAAAVELLAAAGLACALAGVAELALVRARLRSALSLSRSEAGRERRAQGGAGRAQGEIHGLARHPERP
jgi:hypothetical protein